jgi:hypothetical protein
MSAPRLASVVVLGVLIGSAGAQPVAPPPTATVVRFDDCVATPGNWCTNAPDSAFAIPDPFPPDTYVAQGVIFTGFGTNGGSVFLLGNGNLGNDDQQRFISDPNALSFISLTSNTDGGLVSSPETLSFYPPITSLQFDVTTIGLDCVDSGGAQALTVSAFASGGGSLGSVQMDIPDSGATFSFSYPSGAAKVVVTGNKHCGPPGNLFDGLDLFSMDNVAYVSILPTSKCGPSEMKAAGKYAKAQAQCYSKALLLGEPVDSDCLARVQMKFEKTFEKAGRPGDCPSSEDAATTGATVSGLVTQIVDQITGGGPGPDLCFGMEIKAAGVKTDKVMKCYLTAAKKGAAPDAACVTHAGSRLNTALEKCGTPEQLAPLETLIDGFANGLSRTLAVATTTTTTTTTSTTTTTTVPPLGQHLSFTTTAGTANCNFPAAAPFSGTLFSDTAATTPLQSLGLGCLYIGGGNASAPPSKIPENATTILDSADGMTLTASYGTGPRDCSRGPAATRHCVNDPSTACTNDTECAFVPGGCAFDANCFFGPPVPIEGFPSNCVVNTIAADASGTIDTATGSSTTNISLQSRVYLTLVEPTACPQCISGACNYGGNSGGPCTTTNSQLTTLDCPPDNGTFIGTIPVNLSPLSTASSLLTAGDGLFCPGQLNAGAFAQVATQAIQQVGVSSGDLTDGLPHPGVLVSNFCIPPTGNGAVDGIADLPGPGSLSLPGNAQFVTP